MLPSHQKHFLDMRDFSTAELKAMLAKAAELKAERKQGKNKPALAGRKLAMIFEKPSTRTRVSFEVGMLELGGQAIVLNKNDIQLGHGESIADTARVLSRFVDGIMLRCHGHETVINLAKYASVPVINGLTDYNHPCQIMADLLTFEERKGSIEGKTVAWIGDGNNVAATWIVAAQRFGATLKFATPESCMPCADTAAWAKKNGADIQFCKTMEEAVAGADAVITDTWVSMGVKDGDMRRAALAKYQVNDALMARANKDAIFMHCLPAHRGEEVTDSVMDGAQSAVWDEAENRLHAQKAILLACFGVA